MWHKQYNNERRRADSIPAQSRAFTRAVIFVPLLSSMLDFKNDSFNFWEGVTLMTPLTDQSVAQSADITFSDQLSSLGTPAKQVLKEYMVPGAITNRKPEKTSQFDSNAAV